MTSKDSAFPHDRLLSRRVILLACKRTKISRVFRDTGLQLSLLWRFVGTLKPSFVKGLPGDPCIQIIPTLGPKVYKYG